MIPDYDRAATLAAETLIKMQVTCLPIEPKKIIPTISNSVLLSFIEIQKIIKMPEDELREKFAPVKDAFTYVITTRCEKYNIIAYNQNKPFDCIRFALAHEIGHVLLGHTGQSDLTAREAEADHFARHLLAPRAFSAMRRDMGIPPIDTNFIRFSGCSPQTLAQMAKEAQPSHVDKTLNRAVHNQLSPFVDFVIAHNLIIRKPGKTDHIICAKHMEGYEE